MEKQGFDVKVIQTTYYDINDFGLIHAKEH